MLCEKCTPDIVLKNSQNAHEKYLKRKAEGGGCYRINGKIVH
jgi:hypothetical protein